MSCGYDSSRSGKLSPRWLAARPQSSRLGDGRDSWKARALGPEAAPLVASLHHEQGPLISPQSGDLVVVDDLTVLFDDLPPRISQALRDLNQGPDLLEVVLDLGREPE